jgi:hypothetical protein
MARRPASMAGEAAQFPVATVAPPPVGQAPVAPARPSPESAASRALAAIRAWEASAERAWLAGGAWTIIQDDPRYDAATTDAEDPDYVGNVAVFDDGSRLVHGTTGWAMGPRRGTRPVG